MVAELFSGLRTPVRIIRNAGYALGILAGVACIGMPNARADEFLDQIVSFNGEILFVEHGVPALVIGAIRNGETSIAGFGERVDGSGLPPDGSTLMRIGSITKTFTGEVLAHLTANNKVQLTQPLVKSWPEIATAVDPNVKQIRLIDLVTHSGGLPREVPVPPGPYNDPYRNITIPAFTNWLKTETLLYKPGRSVMYSNFGFDLLAHGLSLATAEPYPALLERFITEPLAMKDTSFAPTNAQKRRLMQGHDFDGKAMPDVPTGDVIVGSGGLYSTPNDLLRWMQWHLNRFGKAGAETRSLDHALYLVRDGLDTVSGMDESGEMDAIGLAWVAMMPEGNRPFILQKAGGLQGTFTYIAFAPARGVAVFVAINQFDVAAATDMAQVANNLIATLAPR